MGMIIFHGSGELKLDHQADAKLDFKHHGAVRL